MNEVQSHPCPPDCCCGRHQDKRCLPGCECGKHQDKKCLLGCECAKHSEVFRVRVSEQMRGSGTHLYKDGRTQHPEHSCWYSMIDRCHRSSNDAYHNYGGRGILVCDEWRNDPWTFFRYLDEVLGPRPLGYSLDRIDNDGNYEPGNIRWADQSTQVLNSRRWT